MVYISMVNRLAWNYEINPAILTEGFWWFKDLSAPDPLGILPVLGGLVSFANILTSSATNSSSVMRKIRRYIYIMPILTIPVWMTFPCAFNLYWLTTASVQLIIVNMFRSDRIRRAVGIPEYLPGSKLERMNTTIRRVVEQPVTFSSKPSKKKL